MAEQWTLNPLVPGSSPGGGTKNKYMLTPEDKEKLIKKYKIHKTDTGSPEVQIVLLTENIKKVLSHLKKHPKDLHTRRGLLKMVIKRKRLLKYLEKESPKRYKSILKKVGLKNKTS